MHKKTHKPVVVLSLMIMLLLSFFNISAQTASSNRFKRIDYEYDLISGNVNKVMYQKDSVDQFVHQYDYDSDNRITKVETSSDNVTWDVEAKYFYYAHGPLARTEYGDINNQVQGVDYAYTIQGWIKGVNSNTLDKNRDMGQDGLENEIYDPIHPQLHSNIAKDAFGYSLNYFKNDYKAIGYLRWSSVTNRFEASTTNSDLTNSRNDLYNGNISSMVTTIVKPTITTGNTYDFTPLPQGAAYKYDQLNRLVEMKAWQNLNSVNNTWGTGLAYNGLYNNKFTFDANGNILTQLRKDETGVAINDLSYRRFNLASKTMQNRLYMVDDAVSNTVFTDDIDDQGTFDNSTYTNVKTNNNYGYDEIGSLTRNNQKQIAQIKYTVYGKVKEVVRTNGSTKKNLKFDYDASGNRIAKHVYSSSNVWEKSEYYVVDAEGNVMSVYKHEATGTTPPISFAQIEKNIYGSTRIGSDKTNKELIAAYIPNGNLNHVLGNKQYDGVNHLGNVLVTFTNKRLPIDADNNNIIDEYWPEVVSSNDYYPFGVKMKNRSFSSSNNRYQFNNKQYDEETETSDFGARNLDEDLGSWLTIDPIFYKYPSLSPYNYVGSNPILFIDPDGNKIIIPLSTRIFHRKVYKAYMIFLKSNEGKEIYRDVATAKQAEKLWGDKSGDGVLSKTTNVTLKAGKFKDSEGNLFAHGQTENNAIINGEKKDIEYLTESDIKSVSAPLKTNIDVFLPPERPFLDNVEGAAHESAVHAHGILKFLKSIYDGVRGDDLVKAHKEGELEGDKNHVKFSKGLNKIFESFIKNFSEKLNTDDKKELDKYTTDDKKNNTDG